MLPEPRFHNLSPMNPGIVTLEYARVIREDENPLMEYQSYSVFRSSGDLIL